MEEYENLKFRILLGDLVMSLASTIVAIIINFWIYNLYSLKKCDVVDGNNLLLSGKYVLMIKC